MFAQLATVSYDLLIRLIYVVLSFSPFCFCLFTINKTSNKVAAIFVSLRIVQMKKLKLEIHSIQSIDSEKENRKPLKMCENFWFKFMNQ